MLHGHYTVLHVCASATLPSSPCAEYPNRWCWVYNCESKAKLPWHLYHVSDILSCRKQLCLTALGGARIHADHVNCFRLSVSCRKHLQNTQTYARMSCKNYLYAERTQSRPFLQECNLAVVYSPNAVTRQYENTMRGVCATFPPGRPAGAGSALMLCP